MKKPTFSLHFPLQFGHVQTPIIQKTHFENSFGDLDNLNQASRSLSLLGTQVWKTKGPEKGSKPGTRTPKAQQASLLGLLAKIKV